MAEHSPHDRFGVPVSVHIHEAQVQLADLQREIAEKRIELAELGERIARRRDELLQESHGKASPEPVETREHATRGHTPPRHR
jgi:hypothetical protein